MDNEFLLQDRLQKIRQIINQYGEDNFYLSFSGGKDSTLLSHLIDMALPENKIPRVFANTGIELKMIVDFVKELQKDDDRLVIIQPSQNIQKTLKEFGYPFKSKEHSFYVSVYQNNMCYTKAVNRYLYPEESRKTFGCPPKLMYQFNEDFKLKISKKCCDKLKKEPIHLWQKENDKPYAIIGIMASEKGGRSNANCLAFRNNKLFAFQPLVPVTKEWEDWYLEKYDVHICDIYKPPYNFDRTGCKGCPYNIKLQSSLDILEKYFPDERKQCEIIWKPVYDEYRRLGYRLKKEVKNQIIDDLKKGQLEGQMDIFDFLDN